MAWPTESPVKTKRYGGDPNPPKVLLVAPRHPRNFWSMKGTAELLGARALMPNAALATLMALTPEDVSVEYMLCDENAAKLDFDTPCDLVGVTGSTLHAPRLREICGEFSSRGIPVALGGTFASICTDQCQGLANHLFVGEAEYTWPRFLREWLAGNAAATYVQNEHVELAHSPPPDWSLIRPAEFVNLCVQTSRGCPNSCDFCDVIQYVGRRFRTKSIDQIMTEVGNAHKLGARSVFFSDDNFLGDRAFTRRLLQRLEKWNSSLAHPLSFSTQCTLQVADDDELLKLFADARFSVLFLGVETVRRESLAEVHKLHNLNRDPVERIRRISHFGLVPFVGLIVGFDHDDSGVFKELEEFIEETAAPIAGISLLNAPRRTPLYERLKAENRLVGDDFSGEWQLHTNIIPKQMTLEELTEGYWDLFARIFDPERFEARLGRWLSQVEYFPPTSPRRKRDYGQLLRIWSVLRYCLLKADPPVRSMFFRKIRWGIANNPRHLRRIFTLLTQYRHFYDFVKAETEGRRRAGPGSGAAG